ncbi:MAG: DUF58 domain-containing protein [Roseburia sp.]|nr:DUF58 domain-containing protein [Roseburia sp.]MCM1099285.1 DUF58 domain-containing protein [Ruminococcus flavefaciens]
MIKRRVTYLLIVGACVWLCMLYTFQGLRFLLGILLAASAVCLLFLLFRAPWCRADMGEIPAYVERGEKVTLPVTVSYRGVLPLPGAGVTLKWTMDGMGKKKVRRLIRGMGGRTQQELSFEFSAKHCGQAEFWIDRAWTCDSLGLFRLSVKAGGQASLLVIPVISPPTQSEAVFLMNYLKSCKDWEEGDYFIRGYRPGDSLRSIHWKLTAKEEDFQVKDIQPDTAVRLFLHMTDELLATAESRDAYLDKACSVMAFLAEQAALGFTVSWPQDGRICRCAVHTGQDIYLCIRELVKVKKAGETFSEDSEEQARTCRLEPDGRLYLGERCVDEE